MTNLASKESEPAPSERRGVMRVATTPPGRIVRILGSAIGIAGEQGLQEQRGAAPQELSVTYRPGPGMRVVFRAFLVNPPEPGEDVTLSSQIFDGDDGQAVPGTADSLVINSSNQQTAFILSILSGRELPAPPPANIPGLRDMLLDAFPTPPTDEH